MDFNSKCESWFNGLPAEFQERACYIVDLVPDWMVVSLREADIALAAAEMTCALRHGFLMPTALMEFLESKRMADSGVC
ncbi:MAG: hypothetical protein JWM34_3765 [Ilumatobacteraceae bacterium]|nr:hypothetical protein [Ilumatobacteraceae bacterium]